MAKKLPIVPKDMLEAYDYGIMCDQLQIAEAANDTEAIQSILDEVNEKTGRDDVSLDQMHELRAEIENYVN